MSASDDAFTKGFNAALALYRSGAGGAGKDGGEPQPQQQQPPQPHDALHSPATLVALFDSCAAADSTSRTSKAGAVVVGQSIKDNKPEIWTPEVAKSFGRLLRAIKTGAAAGEEEKDGDGTTTDSASTRVHASHLAWLESSAVPRCPQGHLMEMTADLGEEGYSEGWCCDLSQDDGWTSSEDEEGEEEGSADEGSADEGGADEGGGAGGGISDAHLAAAEESAALFADADDEDSEDDSSVVGHFTRRWCCRECR